MNNSANNIKIKKNRDKKTKKKTKISIARLLIFIMCMLVFGRILYGFFLKHPKTEIVKYGSIELSEEVIGYLVKNETVIQSPVTGRIERIIEEGKRVKKGVNVISIIKNASAVEYKGQVAKLDDEIKQIQSNIDNDNLFQNDIIKIDSIIKNKLDEASQIMQSHDTSNLSKIKSEINELLSKKKIITGQVGAGASVIKQKANIKENYSNQINQAKVSVPTSISGILSYSIDGCENILSEQSLDSITATTINSLENKIQGKNKLSDEIVAGQPAVKLIDNFEWYIVCVLKNTQVEPLRVGDNVYISFDDKTRLPSKVRNINLEQGSDRAVVVFSLTNNLEQFYNNRKINIKIIKRSFEGIKIPLSSIVKKDDNTNGVLLVDEGITKFKEIDILGRDNQSAIVVSENELSMKKGLSIYNEIVINPSKFNEGMLLK